MPPLPAHKPWTTTTGGGRGMLLDNSMGASMVTEAGWGAGHTCVTMSWLEYGATAGAGAWDAAAAGMVVMAAVLGVMARPELAY